MQISSSPYIVALTGGIASGKTAASSHFEKLGAHIVDTDLISRQCTPPGSPALKTIEAAFGPQSVDKDGHLNRAWMREHIFNHPQARAKLENIVHPLIFEQAKLACAKTPAQTYAILVVPLWVENPLYHPLAQRVCVVDIPEALQWARLKARSGFSDALIQQMLSAQASRAARLAKADDVLDNSKDFSALLQQVERLHKQYHQAAMTHAAIKINTRDTLAPT